MSTAKRIGKYEVLALLSRTARAAVYRGEDSDTKHAVAIKVIPRSGINSASLDAFRKYAQALARLEEPGVATFFEIVENEKALGLVSELCEGKALSALLKEGAHPELRSVWDIARPMLEALSIAHAKGVVHRDLKPSNVMLAPDGRVKITDFGVSMLYSAPADEVHYRAPEQFTEAAITSRTDIYQAGAIIYQMVTGKLPFTGTPEEVEHRIHQERPTDPSSYNNGIAWQLDWVIQKALSKDPDERFAKAIDFAEGLRLGLQDTVGRPLDPLSKPSAPKEPPPPALARNMKAIAKPPAPPPAPTPASAGPAPSIASPPVPPATPVKPAAPVNSAAPAASEASAPKPADDERPRVLFVDDDERILNGVRALFRQEYNVTVAASGEAALEIVNGGGIHVVVSDQRMPGMTGVELLRKVRVAAPNAVRMLLTGYTDLASLVGSINDGEIFRFVKKPWDNDEIRADLADAVNAALAQAGTVPVKPESPRSAGSLLVIDPKDSLARGLERLLAGTATVIQVATPADAAKALQGSEIAAIVADLGAGMDGLVALFKQVKAKRPGVHTILLADEPDAELGIELINKAQIFRFLPKPVSAKDLRHQVAEALRRYAAYKQSATAKDAEVGAGAGVSRAPNLAQPA